MLDLPVGTVTFLFTDMQDSTPPWERQPELMAQALQIHNAALRQAIAAHGGVVFKTVGDEFQSAFPTALQALKASIAGQQALQSAPWNELGPLKVRIGLHTGEALPDSDGKDYTTSHTLNRVGRIRSAAWGGQVLLSQETADLVRRALPEGVSLRDLGEHRLKGLSLPERLYQMCAPGLPPEFPPLASAITHPNNLPIHLTSFIGRESEIASICELLLDHRLVTLTGTGGTGKTRLSLQVAGLVLENYPNGAWLVELAPLADPALVPQTVASALNLPEIPGKSVTDTLVDFLRSKRLLLILDNCEHLLDACTRLVDRLLRACPELTILASSREFLGVKGEIPSRVPPMALPDAHHLPPLEALAEFDAVRLFADRARLVAPGFTITAANAAAVSQVVNRLDGIPLAIELAASRLRLLSLEQVAQRLNDVFRLLTGGSRTVLPRHQTLRALIDWSYNLLSDPERILLRRLSVFAGGWTLEAAEQVCAYEFEDCQQLRPDDILDLLSGLVDKSLVNTFSEADGIYHFTMLETVRQYAGEKLAGEKVGDRTEAEAIRTRHMAYFLELAEALGPKIRSHGQIQTLDRLELELDNLRLALEWALQTDVRAELRITSALFWFWEGRNYSSEAIDWLKRGFEAEKQARQEAPENVFDTALRAQALVSLGYHSMMQYWRFYPMNYSLEQAKDRLTEALSLYHSIDPQHHPEIRKGMAWAKLWLSFTKAWLEDDQEQVLALLQEALDSFREIGDPHGVAESLALLGNTEADPVRKIKIYQESLAISQANQDISGIAGKHRLIGNAAYTDGEYLDAFIAHEASLECYRQVGDSDLVARQLYSLGWVSLASGDLLRAGQYNSQSLAGYYELGFDNRIAEGLFQKCILRIAEGCYDLAAEANHETWRIYQKTGKQSIPGDVLYTRSRLARLSGDIALAHKHAGELLNYKDTLSHQRMWAKVELGYMALHSGELPRASGLFREGIQFIILRTRESWFIAYPLDALALLAVRQNQMERAASLFGTRWCRGAYHFLTPPERLERHAALAESKAALGEAHFEQFYEEGRKMTMDQAIALALEVSDE